MPLNIPSKSQDTQVFVADWAKKGIEDEHGVIFKFFKILKFKANCKNYFAVFGNIGNVHFYSFKVKFRIPF